MRSKIMVGMSGGVDSSVAAALLRKQGHDVAGVTLKLWKENGDNRSDIEDAERVCRAIDIPHFVLDAEIPFREAVVENFISEYRRGRTPNPCILCNKKIKFGLMLDFALEHGYEFISTGHYVEKRQEGEVCHLLCSENLKKDQSYVLYHLTQRQLRHSIFPLVSYSKEEIRKMAAEWRLPVATKADSQDICFLPNDYAGFIERYSEPAEPGDFLDSSGNVIGRHRGILHYTIGQRKGLGGTFGKPMFVTEINAEQNTVTLGESGEEFFTELTAGELNFIEKEYENQTFFAEVMIRYNSKRYPGKIQPNPNGTVTVIFEESPRAVTPGQAAVFYCGRRVIGGGTIL